jgi:hypothetical protein
MPNATPAFGLYLNVELIDVTIRIAPFSLDPSLRSLQKMFAASFCGIKRLNRAIKSDH